MLDPILGVPRQAAVSGEFFFFVDDAVDEPHVLYRGIVLEGGAVEGEYIEFEAE